LQEANNIADTALGVVRWVRVSGLFVRDAEGLHKTNALGDAATVEPGRSGFRVAVRGVAIEQEHAHARQWIWRRNIFIGASQGIGVGIGGKGISEIAAVGGGAQCADGADGELEWGFDFLLRSAMTSEERRIYDGLEDFPDLAFGRIGFPSQHALADEVCFGRKIASGIIVSRISSVTGIIAWVGEVVTDEQPAELDADVFFGEGEIRDVGEKLVALGNAVSIAGAVAGNDDLIFSGNGVRTVEIGSPGKAITRRDKFVREDSASSVVMPIGSIVENPGALEIGFIAVGFNRAGKDAGSIRGSEGVGDIGEGDFLDAPAGPDARLKGDIVLIVAIVGAHAEQFHQLAGVIFVGDAAGIATAGDGIEINNHGWALGTDFQEVVKRASWIEQCVAPFFIFQILELRSDGVLPSRVVIIVLREIKTGFRPLRDKMVFQELKEDFEELAFGADSAQDVPAAKVREKSVGPVYEIGGFGEFRFEIGHPRACASDVLAEAPGSELLGDVGVRANRLNALDFIRRGTIGEAVQNGGGQQGIGV